MSLHRKVAGAIESVHATRLADHLPALAYHYAQSAVPGAEPAKAVDYARRAAAAALAQLAHDDAVRYYRQALEILDAADAPVDENQHIELLISLGEAEGRAGSPAYRETLFEAARRARQQHDNDALARAALLNCRGSLMSAAGRADTDRIELLQAALDGIDESDSPTRARLMAHIALEQTWTVDREELARLSDAAVAMARRLRDPATLADVLLTSFYAIQNPSTLQQRIARADELVALAGQLGDGRLAVHAYWHRTRAMMETGDVDEARRCTERQERLAADLGEPALRWLAAVSSAGPPVVAGKLEEAEERNDSALAIGRDVQPDAETYWAAQAYVVRHEQGRIDELLPFTLGFVADPGFRAAIAQAMVAFIYADTGQLEDSRRYYAPLAANRFTDVRFDNVWLASLAFCSEVSTRLGDTASAAHLSDLLAPYHDQLATISSTALNCVSHYLGLLAAGLGRYDEAESRFSAAAATQRRIGAPGWLARTRLEWARMLLGRGGPGDSDRARDLLAQALSAARELGLGGIERQAAELRR